MRLIPPIYVKPFVKRHKNDAADAEAIVEAALRPTMRFVAVKSERSRREPCCFELETFCPAANTADQRATRSPCRIRICGGAGTRAREGLADAIATDEAGLPIAVRELGQLLLEQISALDGKTGDRTSGFTRLPSLRGRRSVCRRCQA